MPTYQLLGFLSIKLFNMLPITPVIEFVASSTFIKFVVVFTKIVKFVNLPKPIVNEAGEM